MTDTLSPADRATPEDIDDIVGLLQANEIAHGGALSSHFERGWVAARIAGLPVMIVRRGPALAGVLVSAAPAAIGDVPIIAAMLATYRGDPDAYVYGPICVAAGERGKGVGERLFAALKQALAGREGILFIREDNAASLHVHRDKLGMTVRGRFAHDGAEHLVLSYRG
jgi:GNAT superfamily N-acetyltransferase